MKKTRSYKIHTARRAIERYGFEFTMATLASFVNQIQSNKGQFVKRTSNRVTVWDVSHPDTEENIRVVYDKIRKSIVTILPKTQ